MPSFRQICAQAPVLVIDAASAEIQVGLLNSTDGRTAEWRTSHEEAGVAIFQCMARVGVDVSRVRAFAFCEGPGSVLGIRTAAMALRTWCVLQPRPVFAYCSLALVAHALDRNDIGVIADARRESWHYFRRDEGLRRLATTELSGELVMPEHFRQWSTLPTFVPRTSYTLTALIPKIWDIDLLHPTDSPDAFLHEEPNYVTWTPQIHRPPER